MVNLKVLKYQEKHPTDESQDYGDDGVDVAGRV